MATAASPTDRQATVAGDGGLNLPTDALAEILLRLPPSRRRWVRLVCRHWRAVIDERTPQSPPPKVLACFKTSTSASAVVVDDLAYAYGRCREVWGTRIDRTAQRSLVVTVVGTCNGLLCLYLFDRNKKPGGAIALLNPLTRETLRLPPLPASRWRTWDDEYSFGYHPGTGMYKILHLPRFGEPGDPARGFTALQVFTLGEDSWRDVAVPDASGWSLDAGLVSAGGATYWVTWDVERVVSFDLKEERIAFAAPLPVGAQPGCLCRLTEFHGRLGLAVSADKRTPATTEVWVLGDGKDPQGWTRRYRVRVQQGVEQRLAAPYFAHGGEGEYVLAVESNWDGRKLNVYAHRMRGAGTTARLQCGEVRSLRIREPGEVVAVCKDGGGYFYNLRTFAYVETKEPLSAYKIVSDDRKRKVNRQRKPCTPV